jgi:hypothetical protein
VPEAATIRAVVPFFERICGTSQRTLRHGRYIVLQMAEVALPRQLSADICGHSATARDAGARRRGLGMCAEERRE